MQKNSLIKGALILTIANLVTRVLGFVHRIYMSNAIGAEGIGLYQLIFPIYMLAWSISSSGLSTAISRLTAKEYAKREYGNAGKVLKHAVVIACTVSLVLTFLLFVFGKPIAIHIVKDERTAIPLTLLSLCFPFMAAGSCIRGYFHGIQKSTVPAISQVVEQGVRMISIYLFAGFFIDRGLVYACSVAVFGICLGELISFAYTVIAYIKFKRDNHLVKRPTMKLWETYSVILLMAIPLTANRVTGSLLSTFENILIPQRLMLYGLTRPEAMSAYGELMGMVSPLIYFPSAFLVSLSISLVPDVTQALTLKNEKRMFQTISKSLLFACVIGMGASCLFIVFSREICQIIYGNGDIGKSLFTLSFLCPFIYVSVIVSGLLNGIGEQVFIFKTSILSSAICIGFVYFLVPRYGINAFIVGWFCSLVFVNICGLSRIAKRAAFTLDYKNWLIKPFGAACFSICFGMILKYIFPLSLSSWVGLCFVIVLMMLSYLLYLMLVECILVEDVKILGREIKVK